MNKLCISIRGFKRPGYLKQCLESLENNSDLDVDFFFIQDGAVNPFSGIRRATDEEIKESLRVFQNSKLPNKTIFVSQHNLGPIIRNKLQLEYIFPLYEYGVLIDNDLIFNKYYIKTLKILFEQFKNSDAGSIQTSFRHHGNNIQSLEDAIKLQNKVTFGHSHRWEIGLWRESWDKIKPIIAPYFKLTERVDFREFLYNSSVYKDIRNKCRDIYGCQHGSGDTPTEDFVLEKSVEKAGYKGLHTLTLRHKTIGEKGMFSFRSTRFKDGEYGKIKLHNIGNIDKYEISN